jgi:hypothetical protein
VRERERETKRWGREREREGGVEREGKGVRYAALISKHPTKLHV